eukprot:9425957-Pyramimonas_sp.AAC.1
MSTAFSGIGAPENAAFMIQKSVRKYLELNHPGTEGRAIQFAPQYAIECNSKAQAELSMLPEPPAHIFEDISDFVPDNLRTAFGLNGTPQLPMSKLKNMLMKCDVKLEARCVIHGEHCAMERSHIHIAGTHCTMHSQFGLRKKDSGKEMKFFWVWVAMRRKLKDVVIFHENVKQFGTTNLEEGLGDLYFIIKTLDNVREIGWATARLRRITILVLKTFAVPVLKAPR